MLPNNKNNLLFYLAIAVVLALVIYPELLTNYIVPQLDKLCMFWVEKRGLFFNVGEEDNAERE